PLSLLLVAACAVAVAASAAVAASGTPRWVPLRVLSPAGADGFVPETVVDAQGDVIVAWAQAKANSWTIEARERAPGKSWGPPLSLSVAADHVASLDLVRTGNRVACVWSRFDGQNLIAQAAFRD